MLRDSFNEAGAYMPRMLRVLASDAAGMVMLQ